MAQRKRKQDSGETETQDEVPEAAPDPTVNPTPVEQELAAQEPSAPKKETGRSWAQRNIHPVKFRRFSLKNEMGAEQILFTFELKPGETKLPAEVLEVLQAHKFWKDGEPFGLAPDARTDDESYPTGLSFGKNKKFPKAWVLPSNEFGRTVADSLTMDLLKVAGRLTEQGQTPF